MYKKSSSSSRGKKGNGSTYKKDNNRSDSSARGAQGGRDSGDGFRKDKSSSSFGKGRPSSGGFKKDGGGRSGGSDRGGSKPGFKPGDRSGKPAFGYWKDDKDDSGRKTYTRDKDRTPDNRPPSDKRPFGDRDNDRDRGPKKDFSKPYNPDKSSGPSKRPYSGRIEGGGPDRDKREGGFRNNEGGAGSFRKSEGGAGGFRKSEGSFGDRKPFNSDRPRSGSGGPGGKKPFSDRRPSGDGEDRPRREFNKPADRDNRGGEGERRPFGDRPFRDRKDSNSENTPRRPFKRDDASGDGAERRSERTRKPRQAPAEEGKEPRRETPADFYQKKTKSYSEAEERYLEDGNEDWEEVDDKRKKKVETARYPMPLNKFIAHSGECSRRDAAELVKQGKAKVNGELITDPGHKVNELDKVTLSGKKLLPQKGLVYILLNKPKGFITTNDDPQGRRTVMDLVKNADAGRLYPVGRLDRATTGLILITNDGDLAQRMAHPTHKTKKVYHVTLDKALTQPDFDSIMVGLDLEDGKAIVDEMAYLEQKTELGLEIHSGKNRIVRRIFESLGYSVEKLDRVMYAGLTKKNLPRSKWRFLDEREIVLLKHFKV